MKHSETLSKIHKAIYNHIDQIIQEQSNNNGLLDRNQAAILVEYSKLFRTDKTVDDDETDYESLTIEQLNLEIAKAAKAELDKVKKK